MTFWKASLVAANLVARCEATKAIDTTDWISTLHKGLVMCVQTRKFTNQLD